MAKDRPPRRTGPGQGSGSRAKGPGRGPAGARGAAGARGPARGPRFTRDEEPQGGPPRRPKPWERTRPAGAEEGARPPRFRRDDAPAGPGSRPPRRDDDRPRAPRAYGDRPARPRREDAGFGDRPARPRREGAGGFGDRPARPRREDAGVGDRPARPRREGASYGDRPARPRREDAGFGDRPARPRREGASYSDRPARPRREDAGFGDRPARPRREDAGFGDRPARPRREGAGFGDRPARPRREGSSYGDRPARPRREDAGFGERPARPRREGASYGDRPARPRRDDAGPGDRPSRPRREGAGYADRPSRPRRDEGERPVRVRRDGEGTDRVRPARDSRPAAGPPVDTVRRAERRRASFELERELKTADRDVPEYASEEPAHSFADQSGLAVGYHAVRTMLELHPRRVERLLLARGQRDHRTQHLVRLATENNVPYQQVPREALDRLGTGVQHQGVVAKISGTELLTEDELLEKLPAEPLLLVIDGVQDPRNLGAILRTGAALGVDGVFLPGHRSVGVSPAAVRTAAGGVELLPIARAGNVAQLLRKLTERGITAVALDVGGPVPPWEANLTGAVALIAGGEEKGIRPVLLEQASVRVRIPVNEAIGSLNVSVATGIVLAEAARQRGGKAQNP